MRFKISAAIAAAVLVFLTACTPSPFASATAGPSTPQAYTTGDNGELVTTVEVSKPPAPYGRAVVYCLDLLDAPRVGEVLQAIADLEVTNDLNIDVNVETHILLSSSCAGTDGVEIVESNGTNCTPAAHHCSPTRIGAITVPARHTGRFVVLVALAQASQAEPGATIQVEQDYGRLSVLRWR
jgi:hypothetical protein